MGEFLDGLCWEGLKVHPVPCPAMPLSQVAQSSPALGFPPLTTSPGAPTAFVLLLGVSGSDCCAKAPGWRKQFHLILLHPGLQLSSLKSPRDFGRPQRHGNPVLGLELTQLLVFITECLICPFLRKCDSLAWLTPALKRQS